MDSSEIQFQSELDLPVVALGRTDHARAPCAGSRIGVHRAGRQREVRVIEHVEDLGTEFEVSAFSKNRVLGEREVELLESRRDHGVASQVPEGSRCLQYKGAGIEP